MATKTRQSLASPDIQFGEPKLDRLMQHVRAITAEVQRLQQLLAGGTAGQVLEKSDGGDYKGGWNDVGGSSVTGAKNLGGGQGIFVSLSGTVLQFKSLAAGSNITLDPSDSVITISASAGTGSGTVTSVSITSTDLNVQGSPIETFGVITLNLNENAVTYDKLQETSADAVVLGRASGSGIGNVQELNALQLATIIGSAGGYPLQLGYAGIV